MAPGYSWTVSQNSLKVSHCFGLLVRQALCQKASGTDGDAAWRPDFRSELGVCTFVHRERMGRAEGRSHPSLVIEHGSAQGLLA